MLISFFNPSNLIGCGGDINQSEEGYAEGVHGGGMWRGYAEDVCGGFLLVNIDSQSKSLYF